MSLATSVVIVCYLVSEVFEVLTQVLSQGSEVFEVLTQVLSQVSLVYFHLVVVLFLELFLEQVAYSQGSEVSEVLFLGFLVYYFPWAFLGLVELVAYRLVQMIPLFQ